MIHTLKEQFIHSLVFLAMRLLLALFLVGYGLRIVSRFTILLITSRTALIRITRAR